MQITKQSFPPLIDAQSRLLILGTLPGEDSLKFQQYYGHSRNQFWRLLGDVLGVDLLSQSYKQRTETLIASGVGLWDTLAAAQRKGSLDNQIRMPQHNDIPKLLQDYPAIQAIAFNGKQARRFFKPHEQQIDASMVLIDLPSSSPAYTLAYAEKQSAWLGLQAVIEWVKS